MSRRISRNETCKATGRKYLRTPRLHLFQLIRQLIYGNQSLVGFNIPTLRREQIAECVPDLLSLISRGKLRLFANNSFPLSGVGEAFEALSGRRTIGKVVLLP